ncbi:PRKCA-binding protein isoform X2 [Haliaeetus albicilla]|uniref:PRKCA-binding protein isoform X2 n=1 Tax=Haliaeetus albicilla TaxID=8969 RepID=UPI0037E90B31
MFADLDYDIEEDKLGIPTVPGTVTLKKDSQNLIGISIGGGAQYCPCLYIVQVFDNTPAALDGTVAAGDEITGVNGKSVKGKTKVEVAKMIQMVKGEVTIHYNKLQADPKQGKSLDIVLKKVKHRLVENMSSGTADALGLSRAILCNDGLVKRLEELERTAELYKGLTEHTKSLLRAFFELSQTHRAFGDVFSVIGVREPQPAASEAFVKFADAHRNIEKFGIHLLKTIKPMLTDLNTYLNKAIPDTRLTIKKYLDVKFEYLLREVFGAAALRQVNMAASLPTSILPTIHLFFPTLYLLPPHTFLVLFSQTVNECSVFLLRYTYLKYLLL